MKTNAYGDIRRGLVWGSVPGVIALTSCLFSVATFVSRWRFEADAWLGWVMFCMAAALIGYAGLIVILPFLRSYSRCAVLWWLWLPVGLAGLALHLEGSANLDGNDPQIHRGRFVLTNHGRLVRTLSAEEYWFLLGSRTRAILGAIQLAACAEAVVVCIALGRLKRCSDLSPAQSSSNL